MKALLLRGPGELVLEELPIPEISDDEVLVEVKYCGICGADLKGVAEAILIPPGTYLGHEFSGVLSKVGKNVEDWKVGDRVVVNPLYMCGNCYACQQGRQSQCDHVVEHAIGNTPGAEHAGGFAKYVRVPIPEKRLHRLPEELSFEEGALVEPVASSLHPVRVSGIRAGEYAIVLGAGPIGLGVIAHLKYAGVALVVATELNIKRAEMAKTFGADYVFNPEETSNLKERVFGLTKGRGVDVVFDCSGSAKAFLSATEFVRRGGQVVITGIIEKEVPIVPMFLSFNEWRLQGSLGYYSDEFPMSIEFLKKRVIPVTRMVTSKIKLSRVIEDGFDLLSKPGNNEVKIIVEPDD